MRAARIVLASLTCALAVAPALANASTGKPSSGCAPGFNLGEYSFADYLLLPRTQAAIADGLVTSEQVLASLIPLDRNGDEKVCVQLPHGFEVNARPFGRYFYSVVENNASAP